MYFPAHNFVAGPCNRSAFPPAGPGYALGGRPRPQIRFADLTRLARASRPAAGLGAGIAPGSACYDATYDPGDIHCASASDVIAGIFSSQEQTTSCSNAEESCLAANPGAAVSGDVCTQAIGLSCSTLILLGVGLTGLIFISRAIK